MLILTVWTPQKFWPDRLESLEPEALTGRFPMVDFGSQIARMYQMNPQPTVAPRRRRMSVLVLGAVALVVGVLALPALAIPGEGFKLSDGSQKVHKEYPPIAGNDPTAQALTPTLANCRDLPANVLIPIEMDFKQDFGSVLEITITWTAPEANDIDIYFFDEGGEVIADSATGDAPESVRLGSLANGQYYLCVRNFSGANAGFVLDASVRFVALFTRTPEPPTDAPASPPPRRSVDTTPQPGAGLPKPAPAITADPVDTPGPDGPFSDKGLITVASGRQAEREEGGLSTTQIVFISLTGAIALGGAGFVAFRIRRDLRG